MGKPDRNFWALAALAALFNVPFLGGVHLLDWDEINFAEISREMVILSDYLRMHVDFVPFTEKPPLFFWLQAAAMNVFGINEFSARLPNAICGMVTLPLLYAIGKKLYDARFGLLWAGGYIGSILPTLYFSSGIIDPVFNLFIFLGLYYFVLFHWKKNGFAGIGLKRNQYFYLSLGGVYVGLAMLTKGQAAYIIVCLAFFAYWVRERFRFYVNVPEFLLYTLAAVAVSLLWYGVETALHGPGFVQDFFIRQYVLLSTGDAGHSGFPGYHAVVLLVGCFPTSVFALRAFRTFDHEHDYQKDFKFWMAALFWGVLILFSVVQSKIVHYSSMAYFPITYLAALTLSRMLDGKISFNGWMKGGLYAIAGLCVLVTVALPFVGMNPEPIKPLIADRFAVANLDAQVGWTGWEALVGVYFLGVVVYAIRQFRSEVNRGRGVAALFLGTAIMVKLTLSIDLPKIEGYSQRANVEFFKVHAEEDAYYKSIFFRSYVPGFYGQIQPTEDAANPYSLSNFRAVEQGDHENPRRAWENEVEAWLLEGDIDKPVYFSTKITKRKRAERYPQLQFLYEKNGFLFYKREPIRQGSK